MAKKRKGKFPKRVAGVKIPKRVRKGPVADFLSSHAGQIAVAEALALAAGAFAAKRDHEDGEGLGALRRPIEQLKATGGRAAGTVSDGSDRIARALREAAQTFRRVMNEDTPEAYRTPQDDDSALEAGAPLTSVDDVSAMPAKKKRAPESSVSDAKNIPH
jgi:hypothetical protein